MFRKESDNSLMPHDLVPGGITGVSQETLRSLREALSQSTSLTLDFIQQEVIVHLLGVSWGWPEFDRFYEMYRGLGVYPRMWNVAEDPPDLASPDVRAFLGQYASLPIQARQVLARGRLIGVAKQRTITLSDLQRLSRLEPIEFHQALEVLKASKMVEDMTLVDRLMKVSVAELTELAAHFAITAGRRKADLVEAIVRYAPSKEVIALLPASVRSTAVKLTWLVPLRIRAAVEWELNRCQLLAHTAMMMKFRQRDLNAARQSGYAMRLLATSDSCPICRKAAGKKLSVDRPDEWPPLHPGCRCATVADLSHIGL